MQRVTSSYWDTWAGGGCFYTMKPAQVSTPAFVRMTCLATWCRPEEEATTGCIQQMIGCKWLATDLQCSLSTDSTNAHRLWWVQHQAPEAQWLPFPTVENQGWTNRAGSWGRLIFRFLRNVLTNSRSGCTSLHLYWQWIRVWLFLLSHILARMWCHLFYWSWSSWPE